VFNVNVGFQVKVSTSSVLSVSSQELLRFISSRPPSKKLCDRVPQFLCTHVACDEGLLG